jgi:hypothetical protein
MLIEARPVRRRGHVVLQIVDGLFMRVLTLASISFHGLERMTAGVGVRFWFLIN